jgi:Lon protease-like protein
MFDELATKAGGQNILNASGVRFGHILSPSVAPSALLESKIGGMPRVGVLASVKRVTRLEDGSLMIEYEGFKRIRLLSIWQSQPYMVRKPYTMRLQVQSHLTPPTVQRSRSRRVLGNRYVAH